MKQSQNGFTIIESLITILVAAIFIITIYALYNSVIVLSVEGARHVTASNLAYTNLRKYANGTKPTMFVCQKTGGGKEENKFPQDTPYTDLPEPVTQLVTITDPYDCIANADLPMLVTSTVTYGPTKRSVTHATYISY